MSLNYDYTIGPLYDYYCYFYSYNSQTMEWLLKIYHNITQNHNVVQKGSFYSTTTYHHQEEFKICFKEFLADNILNFWQYLYFHGNYSGSFVFMLNTMLRNI